MNWAWRASSWPLAGDRLMSPWRQGRPTMLTTAGPAAQLSFLRQRRKLSCRLVSGKPDTFCTCWQDSISVAANTSPDAGPGVLSCGGGRWSYSCLRNQCPGQWPRVWKPNLTAFFLALMWADQLSYWATPSQYLIHGLHPTRKLTKIEGSPWPFCKYYMQDKKMCKSREFWGRKSSSK